MINPSIKYYFDCLNIITINHQLCISWFILDVINCKEALN